MSSRPPPATRFLDGCRWIEARSFLEDLNISDETLRAVQKVSIIACGTSWHAGLVGKYLIEALAQVPVEVDYGSEYRYRNPIVASNELAIVITQSGETADTLAALREAKRKGAHSIAICNVVGSMATREAEGHRLYACRPGNRRGVHEGVHVAARRLAAPRALHGAGSRHARRHADPQSHRRTPPDAADYRAHDQGFSAMEKVAERFYNRSIFFSWDAASTIRLRSKAR
jgi:hypothetical protein